MKKYARVWHDPFQPLFLRYEKYVKIRAKIFTYVPRYLYLTHTYMCFFKSVLALSLYLYLSTVNDVQQLSTIAGTTDRPCDVRTVKIAPGQVRWTRLWTSLLNRVTTTLATGEYYIPVFRKEDIAIP